MGNTPVLSVADPALIERLLVKDHRVFPVRRPIKPITSDDTVNLLQNMGREWKRIRTVDSGLFRSGRMRQLAPAYWDSMNQIEPDMRLTGRCDLIDTYGRLMTRVNCVRAFGSVGGAATGGGLDGRAYRQSVDDNRLAALFQTSLTWRPWWGLWRLALWGSEVALSNTQAYPYVKGIAGREVAERRNRSGDVTDDDKGDVIQWLMNAQLVDGSADNGVEKDTAGERERERE